MIRAKKAIRRSEAGTILNWLRSWLPSQQELERLRETVESLTRDKLVLEERLLASQDERTRLWSLFDKAIEGERAAYQMHVNLSMQRQGAGIPYPEAFHIPPASIPNSPGEAIGRKGRVLPSEMVQQAYRETAEKLTRLAQEQ
jgi:hypothetical protein